MKLFVKVKAGAKTERVEQVDSTRFVIFVKEPPKEGRANVAAIKAFARFLNISPLRLSIVVGKTGRNKILELQ